MMETEKKNKKNRLDNLQRYGKEIPPANPTSEQKKAGWERRRQAQEMMNKVREYMKMPQSEFMALLQDIKNNPDKYTVEDAMLYKYATKAFNGEKFMLDWFDRNISKAPVEVSGADGKDLQPQVNIVNFKNVTDEELKKLLSDQTKWEK